MKLWIIVEELIEILALQFEESRLGTCMFLFLFQSSIGFRLFTLFYLVSILIPDFEQIANVSKIAPRLEDCQTLCVVLVIHLNFSFEDQDDASAHGT